VTAPGLHPSRGAAIVGAGGRVIGTVGEVDPDVSSAYGLPGRVGFLTVSLDALVDEPRRSVQARDVSRFPAGDIDLAFVVAETVPAGDVLATIREAGGELLESAALFDVYRGEQTPDGTRSLAFRLRLRAPDRTLSDTEMREVRWAIIEAVLAAHGAALRG
jgi:phenylalanyl-tRNA synthetase beta chain